MNKNIPILRMQFAEVRKKQVLDVLASGKIARFTLPLSGVWKDVEEWNEEVNGDLIAFRTGCLRTATPTQKAVCWYNSNYILSAVNRDMPEPV